MQGLLAIGLVGALFAPDCALFLLRGDAWWARVAAAFPAQQVCSRQTETHTKWDERTELDRNLIAVGFRQTRHINNGES